MIANRVDAGTPAGGWSPRLERPERPERPEDAAAPVRTTSAAVGWLILFLLALAGSGLLALAASAGAPVWAVYAFALVSGVAVAAYGASVFRFYRRLEAEMPAGEAAAQALAGRLVGAFGELGAGDLVRSVARTAGLPER
ncbi:MAG TPA: hypothetical protein VGR07_06295, partial [Thermoanaerobaculia bacterium]|nr:hypothetical protein [Thermoanaerobaculia bacterium]